MTMKPVARVHVQRLAPEPGKPHLDVAEMFFPSQTKAAQYLARLGFTFEIWKFDQDCLKFRNSDAGEFAHLYLLEE